jgi:citrate lyase gamma subunit
MIRGTVTTIIRDELKNVAERQLSTEMEKRLREASGYEVRRQLQLSGNVAKEVSAAIKEVVSNNVEEQIFQKALSMLKRDNSTIDEIITDRLKGLSLRVGA